MNALAYGVPQFRERVFMVGIHKKIYQNEPDALIFEWDKYALFNTENVLTRTWPKEREFAPDSSYVFPAKGILKKLTVEYWFHKNDVENHPNGNDIFQVKKGRNKIATIAEGDTSGKSFKRLHRWRFSPTAAYGHNEVHLHPYKERRISVAEATAFQVQVNRELKSALNFLITPFADAQDTLFIPQIKFYFDEHEVDITFPYDTLALAESIHNFRFEPTKDGMLNYGLNIKPWFIERVHRALVKAEAFKRLKKPHRVVLYHIIWHQHELLLPNGI